MGFDFTLFAMTGVIMLLRGVFWLAAVWCGWKAYTLGLSMSDPAMFALWGGLAWLDVCVATVNVTFGKER